jgi:hypothetical protein
MNWIKNLFKRKPKEPPFNIYHPDIADKIEFAFECGPTLNKRKFYRMKADANETNDFLLPTGRYKWIDAFLSEVNLRMTARTVDAYLNELEKQLDGTKGQINLGKAFQIIYAMRTRTNLGFDPKLVKTLASVVYFDETEDLSDYDKDYCDKKIKYWEKHEVYDFFLTRPIVELCNLNGTSVTALKTYIQTADQIIKDLTFGLESPSSEST